MFQQLNYNRRNSSNIVVSRLAYIALRDAGIDVLLVAPLLAGASADAAVVTAALNLEQLLLRSTAR